MPATPLAMPSGIKPSRSSAPSLGAPLTVRVRRSPAPVRLNLKGVPPKLASPVMPPPAAVMVASTGTTPPGAIRLGTPMAARSPRVSIAFQCHTVVAGPITQSTRPVIGPMA